MKTRTLLSISLLLFAANSYGDPSIPDSLVTNKGLTYVPPVRYSGENPIYTTMTQHVIQRYAGFPMRIKVSMRDLEQHNAMATISCGTHENIIQCA
jgi:hypothetical protein